MDIELGARIIFKEVVQVLRTRIVRLSGMVACAVLDLGHAWNCSSRCPSLYDAAVRGACE